MISFGSKREGISMRKLLVFCISIIILNSLWTPTGGSQSINPEQGKYMITAEDYHFETTLEVGALLDYDHISWDLNHRDGIYGDFLVTSPASGVDQIVNFLICDQENFDLWVAMQPAERYHFQENVAEYSFKFIVPHTDTWHFVFKNWAILIGKTIDVNLNRDDTPPAISMNLVSGFTYSQTKEITATITEETFTISSVNLYIDGHLMDTEADNSFRYSWNTEDYSDGAHTIRISASDNVGNTGYEEVVVYVSNIDTGNPTEAIPPLTFGNMTSLNIVAGIGLVALYVSAVVLRKREDIF